jgi:hypothetical protein
VEAERINTNIREEFAILNHIHFMMGLNDMSNEKRRMQNSNAEDNTFSYKY